MNTYRLENEVKQYEKQEVEKRSKTERVNYLLHVASLISTTNSRLAQQYLIKARCLAETNKIFLPLELRRLFCPHCFAPSILDHENSYDCKSRSGKKYVNQIHKTCCSCGYAYLLPGILKKNQLHIHSRNEISTKVKKPKSAHSIRKQAKAMLERNIRPSSLFGTQPPPKKANKNWEI